MVVVCPNTGRENRSRPKLTNKPAGTSDFHFKDMTGAPLDFVFRIRSTGYYNGLTAALKRENQTMETQGSLRRVEWEGIKAIGVQYVCVDQISAPARGCARSRPYGLGCPSPGGESAGAHQRFGQR